MVFKGRLKYQLIGSIYKGVQHLQSWISTNLSHSFSAMYLMRLSFLFCCCLSLWPLFY